MNTSTATDQLMPALLKARIAMKPAFKGKKNDHFKYQYANEEAWHDAVQPHLHAHDLLLTFSVGEYGRTGTLSMVRGTARVTHASSGQWIDVNGVGEGDDKADKGAYKAQTGLKKYLYALMFALPTTDDPEDHANDEKRAAETIIAAAPGGSLQADINRELVKAGLPPQHNAEDKAAAMAAFAQLKTVNQMRATGIKRIWGTDYKSMKDDLEMAYREEIEGVAT